MVRLVSYPTLIQGADQYSITEVGFFARNIADTADVLVIYWATANTVLGTKAANIDLLMLLAYQIANGVPTNLTLTFPNISVPTLATQTEAEAGIDNTKRMSPLRTKEAIQALVLKASAVSSLPSNPDTDQVAFYRGFNASAVEWLG